RRAHAADAPGVAVLGWAGRVVGGQIIKRCGNSRLVEVVPERNALAPQQSLAVEGLGCGVKRLALLVWVPVDEVENAVGARAGAIDETCPGDGALRRNAGAEWTESALLAQPRQVRKVAGIDHDLAKARVHAVDAKNDDL